MIKENQIKDKIREVVDFPKPGISFKDITPLLLEPDLCEDLVDLLALPYKDLHIDLVAGIEARGFIFGMLLARKLNCGFLPIRKKGKLPSSTYSQSYKLEYGSAEIELHSEDVKAGQKILIHDDLLATGGTAQAAAELIIKAGGVPVGFNFLVELDFLNARKLLQKTNGLPLYSVIKY